MPLELESKPQLRHGGQTCARLQPVRRRRGRQEELPCWHRPAAARAALPRSLEGGGDERAARAARPVLGLVEHNLADPGLRAEERGQERAEKRGQERGQERLLS